MLDHVCIHVCTSTYTLAVWGQDVFGIALLRSLQCCGMYFNMSFLSQHMCINVSSCVSCLALQCVHVYIQCQLVRT